MRELRAELGRKQCDDEQKRPIYQSNDRWSGSLNYSILFFAFIWHTRKRTTFSCLPVLARKKKNLRSKEEKRRRILMKPRALFKSFTFALVQSITFLALLVQMQNLDLVLLTHLVSVDWPLIEIIRTAFSGIKFRPHTFTWTHIRN